AVLNLPCNFSSNIYHGIPPARREALRAAYDPHRIAFLLEETPYSRSTMALLLRLFPEAEVVHGAFMEGERMLMGMRVDVSDVQRLRSPSLLVFDGHADAKSLASGLLEGVTMTPTNADGSYEIPAWLAARAGDGRNADSGGEADRPAPPEIIVRGG